MKIYLRYDLLKLLSIISMLNLWILTSMQGQSCYPAGITFTTQAEIDQFPSLNPGCKAIGGALIISGNDITNLDSLYSIEVLENALIVYNNSLVNFQGLNNLDSILGSIFIGGLGNSLVNFEGLESLKFVGSDIDLFSNSGNSIENFVGLDSLQIVNGDLTVTNNNNLTSLAGMNNLNQVDKIEIRNCDSITSLGLNHNLNLDFLKLSYLPLLSSLNGAEYLQNINSLELNNLISLLSIDSLHTLTSLSSLNIFNCTMLTSLDGLQNISEINTSIILNNNNALDDISALGNANLSMVEDLEIQNNPNLSKCDISSICDYLSMDGSIILENNKIGCNTTGEIIVACCTNHQDWCPEPMDNCLPEGITFSSQAEVDIFPLAYPSCKIIGGDLVLDGSDITALDSLYSVEIIEGDLDLSASALVNFEGLNNLDTIKQELSINGYYNNSITNFEGLESLKQIGMGYYNDHNMTFASFEDFTGLDSLQMINGKLNIQNCNNLISLSGLEQLAYVDELEIGFCGSFSSIGLSNPLDVDILKLSGLNAMTNLDGIEYIDSVILIDIFYLQNLIEIDSISGISAFTHLTIDNCNNLSDLTGLEVLETIPLTRLILVNNPELQDITALEDADFSALTHLRIRNNSKLSTCDVSSICNYIDAGGNTTIFENQVGCNNVMEIEYDCANLLSIFESDGSSISGNSDNYWHNPNNWKNNEIPGEQSYVIVPQGQNCLIQPDSIANCKILDLRLNAVITSGNNCQLHIMED